jgi:hypothetical protein
MAAKASGRRGVWILTPHCGAGAQTDTRPVLRVAVQALPPTLEPLEAISNDAA